MNANGDSYVTNRFIYETRFWFYDDISENWFSPVDLTLQVIKVPKIEARNMSKYIENTNSTK